MATTEVVFNKTLACTKFRLLLSLSSLPTAFILGKQKGNKVMDFLHAVWLGRNERDCHDAYPECTDVRGQSQAGSPGEGADSRGREDEEGEDAVLQDVRYLEREAADPSSGTEGVAEREHERTLTE